MDEQRRSGDIAEAAQRWYAGLQNTLDENNLNLNLGVREQTIRLVIFSTEQLGDDDYLVTPHYAMDPKARPVDVGGIDEEEMLERQQPELPKSAVVRMYQAAQAGLLFVRDLNAGPRQILVGDDGLPVLGNDYSHPTPEEALMQQLEEPTMPDEPDENTRARAAEGDWNAQTAVHNYDTRLGYHREWEAGQALRAQFPDKARIADSMVIVTQGYFMSQENLYIGDYTARVHDIQTRYEQSGLTPAERERRSYAQAAAERAFSIRDRVPELKDAEALPLGEPLREESIEALSEALVYREEQLRAEGWNTVRSGPFPQKTAAQLQEEAAALRQKADFRQNVRSFYGQRLDDLLMLNPQEVHGRLDRIRQTLSPLPEAAEPAPPLGLNEIGRRFRALHDRLKQEDSVLNWRNSAQYDRLLTALDAAANAFSRAEGYLDDGELDALRESAAEVSRRAEEYRTHIGMAGKNERQQRRLDMTCEVLALSGDIFHRRDPSRWNAVAEAHNSAARETYYAEVRSLTENIPTEEQIMENERVPVGERFTQALNAEALRDLRENEETFELGVRRTEELRSRIERSQQEPPADESRRYLATVDRETLKAREALARMVLAGQADPAKLTVHMAAVMAGSEAHLMNLPNGEPLYRARRQMYEGSDALRHAAENLSVSELNEFLTGPGEHRFTDRLKTDLLRPLYQQKRQAEVPAPERAPEVQKKQPERGGLIK